MQHGQVIAAVIAACVLGCGSKSAEPDERGAPLGTLTHAELESRHGKVSGDWANCLRTAFCGEQKVEGDALGAVHLYWSHSWSLWIWTNQADVVVRVCVPDAPEFPYPARDRFWRASHAVPGALGDAVANRMLAEILLAERIAAEHADPFLVDEPKLRWSTGPTGKLPGSRQDGGETTCWEARGNSAK